jgi:hypothetical protein
MSHIIDDQGSRKHAAHGVEGGDVIDDVHEHDAHGADRAHLGDDQADEATAGGNSQGNANALDTKRGKANKVRSFVDRLHALDQAHKGKRAAVIKEAERADLDRSALLRLASRLRGDPAKMAEREALDHQYRYLAGKLLNPAGVPTGTRLGRVVEMLVDNEKTTVRAISKTLRVSVGTAHTLRRQALAFNVQSDLNMNKSDQKRDAARIDPRHLTTEGQPAAESGSGPVMGEPEPTNAPHDTSNVVSLPRSA